MPRGRPRRLLWILPIVHPHIVREAISTRATAHKLPNAASTHTRDGMWMESRLGLRQINQILRNSFLFQCGDDHVVVASGPCKGTLETSTSAIREVCNVSRHLIGHHKGQVRARVLDLSLSFCLDAGIGGGSDAIGLIDRRWLRFLLCLRIDARAAWIELVYPGNNTVEFFLQAIVGANVQIAAKQRIERIVETLLGFVRLTSLMLSQARLIFLFGASDQVRDRIRGRRRCSRNDLWGGWPFSPLIG